MDANQLLIMSYVYDAPAPIHWLTTPADFAMTKNMPQHTIPTYVHDGIVQPITVQWETVTPWQATYWKQLPLGYRVTYLYTQLEHDE